VWRDLQPTNCVCVDGLPQDGLAERFSSWPRLQPPDHLDETVRRSWQHQTEPVSDSALRCCCTCRPGPRRAGRILEISEPRTQSPKNQLSRRLTHSLAERDLCYSEIC